MCSLGWTGGTGKLGLKKTELGQSYQYVSTKNALQSRVVDPDQHYFVSWIRIRNRVKRLIQICIEVEIQNL
jgi:hypothetical protein